MCVSVREVRKRAYAQGRYRRWVRGSSRVQAKTIQADGLVCGKGESDPQRGLLVWSAVIEEIRMIDQVRQGWGQLEGI